MKDRFRKKKYREGVRHLTDARQNLLDLESWFRGFDSALIAFSAGVDSSVLAYAAHSALGEKAIAVTSVSTSFAQSELLSTRQMADEIGIELRVVSQDDLGNENYVANQVNRCYFCRMALAEAIMPIVRERKISVCVDGNHVDDMKSPRPGIKALREAGFRAPFVELGYHKEDIRDIARMVGLSNAEKPSEACLSSRIAYGQRIDEETLRRVEQSESFIRNLTGAKIVRVRTIGSKAVIELDLESIEKTRLHFDTIERTLKSLGYSMVEIDPNGYTSGRMLQLFLQKDDNK